MNDDVIKMVTDKSTFFTFFKSALAKDVSCKKSAS